MCAEQAQKNFESSAFSEDKTSSWPLEQVGTVTGRASVFEPSYTFGGHLRLGLNASHWETPMLMAVPNFLIQPLELAVAVQRANLALIQGDPNALERNAQGSSVGHRCRQRLEPTRHNPRPARLPFAWLPFKRSLCQQHGLKLRLAVAAWVSGPGVGDG